ncbi:hypothetical protein HPB48_022572 [Haemaphysalis longicornis]|uniref:Fibrinogen C-terminal domain-containing protein n=1 Tax=Haemaphysalis longicornis TaxID=44386 RepID=A0A9J6GTA2_HAELO|nr:hypothetical protein HPB48_022572 [Haemaphysalis longicornis]
MFTVSSPHLLKGRKKVQPLRLNTKFRTRIIKETRAHCRAFVCLQVIQRRGQFGNRVYNFYRNWTEYKRGFGNPSEEYWIGK